MKGQAVSIDFITAIVIFVFMIVAGFYFVQSSVLPRQDFGGQVAVAADSALENFRDGTEWTVYTTAVGVRSGRALDNEPVRVDFPFPPNAVDSSVLVTRGEREMPSQHNTSSNTTLFIADLRKGKNLYRVVYTRSGSLGDRSYSSSLEQGGSSVWNERLNATFTSSGISSLDFDGNALLESEADLGAGSTPALDTGLLESNITYSAGGRKHVRMFEDSGQLRVREFFSGEREWLLNLTSSFDTLYSSEQGGTVDISGSGNLYASTTDWVDFYGSSNGLSIIGDSIFVNVTRDSGSSPVDVAINFSDAGGSKDILLYAHGGNYTNATAQKDDFYDHHDTSVGVPSRVEGVSEQEAEALEKQGYADLGETLGIGDMDYNISVEGVFQAGKDVRGETTVAVTDFPVPVVHRYGNASVREMVMRVWQ